MNDIEWLEAHVISDLYLKKKLSPVEVSKALIDRYKKIDPYINSFIDYYEEDIIASSRICEQDFYNGSVKSGLHGIPIGVKDIIDIKDKRTTCHSSVFINNFVRKDAEVINYIKNHGGIIYGKTALHEFATGGPAFDLPFPPARNPWNLGLHPGGSSSGSGAAVSAGLVPLALGTDTGGSIRNPAGACGIVGLKPTYGLISKKGVFPLSFTLDHIGPMTRSVTDCAFFLNYLVNNNRFSILNHKNKIDYLEGISAGVKGIRIGFVRHFHENDILASNEVSCALDNAASTFREAGAVVEDVTLPTLQDFNIPTRIIMASEAWSIHKETMMENPSLYCSISRQKITQGAFYSAEEYIKSLRLRSNLTNRVKEILDKYDVLLCANSMDLPCSIDDKEKVSQTYSRQARSPFNLTGNPAIALTCGYSSNGHPLSLQIVGKHFDEVMVLRVARAYESICNFNLKPKFQNFL